MFNSESAINSWFEIINKDNDFNYISNHVRRIVYEILSEILKIDDQFLKIKIMLWTYNMDKTDELLNRFGLLVQYFTDLVIHNEDQFSLIHHESDQLSDYLQIHSYINFLRSLCNNSKEFQDYLRVQHNRISSTSILPAVVDLIRVFLDYTKYEVALRVWIDAFELANALVNQKKQENKQIFISSEICKYVKEIMQLGWFSKEKYYLLNGEESNDGNIPFNSNKLILELKLKALQLSNKIYDQNYKYEFIVSIGKAILDENLKMGYAFLIHLNNDSMQSNFYGKNDKASNNLNIQMLFEWFFLRTKISEENEIVQQNIIQISENENFFDKLFREAKLNFFKIARLFKKRSPDINIDEYKHHFKEDSFKADAMNFYESYSSHIEILVPSSLTKNTSKSDPFLNLINNDQEIANEDKTLVTKHLIIQPRFLFMTQKQRSEFWNEFTRNDPKFLCKQLQEYGIEKNCDSIIFHFPFKTQ